MHNRRAQCGKKATREAAKTAASRASTAAAVLMRPSPGVTKSSPAAQRSCRGHAWRAYTEEKRLALNTHHGRVSPKSRLRELLRERAGRQRRRRVAIFAQLDASAVDRERETRSRRPTKRPTAGRTDRLRLRAINRSCRLPLALSALCVECNCGTQTRLRNFYWLLL
jgi:hypothetical protein